MAKDATAKQAREDVEPLGVIERLLAHRAMMRLPQFVRLMGVSLDTGYKWVKEFDLPAAKIGGTYWIDPKQAAGWWKLQQGLAKSPASVRPRKRFGVEGKDGSIGMVV